MKKDRKGLFNLDYEETIILISRNNRMSKLLKAIYFLAVSILNLDQVSFPARDKIKKIVEHSKNEGHEK